MTGTVDRGPRFGWRDAGIFALLFLSLMSDGFDLQAIGFAAPGLVRDWATSRAALGPALSAGLVGMLIGAPALGWFGDRYGRKRAVVLGSVLYAAFTLATAAAGSIGQLLLLRFLTGLGLGGVLPNVIALTAELTPVRVRPLLTSLVTVGMSLGGVTAGIIAASLVPDHGWRILFVVGGIVPLFVALLVQLALAESPLFAAVADRRAAEERRLQSSTARLFAGPFRIVTPLLWLLFAGVLMTIFLMTSWLPLVLESAGMSSRGAALMNTMLQFGGVVGGLGASLLLARVGLPLVAILLGGSWLLLALLALVPLPDVALAGALGLAGICIIGTQTAINAVAGLLYPSEVRARGVGYALGVGRLGSISGPLIGAAMIGLGARGARDLFLVPLVPLGIGLAAALVLVRRCSLRLE